MLQGDTLRFENDKKKTCETLTGPKPNMSLSLGLFTSRTKKYFIFLAYTWLIRL